MAKKAKPSVDKIVKKVNKEFEKTSSQIEGLINDALRQFDSLQTQVEEPVRKLLKDVKALREREMKRLHEEFERRLSELQDFQKSVLERIGINLGDSAKETGQITAPEKPATGAAPKPAPRKKKTGASASKGKAADLSDLTRIKGIGPVTAKKMKEAGIISIEQIANPSDEDREKLKAFKSLKGYSQLTEEARKLL